MSDQFSRDFWAARKKREKEKWEEELEKLGRSESEELSPLYVQKKPTEQSWFQGSSAFEDGYQIGDITKVILGTGQDLTQNVVAGLSGIVESTVDAGAYLVGGAGKLLGADRFAEGVSKFIQKDLINEQKLGEYAAIGLNLPGFILTGAEDFDDLSVLGEKTDGLAQSAGQMLGTIGLGTVGVPWWVTSGVTSFGGQAEQALGEGASYGKAGASALISAGAEVLTEKLFGGSGLGEKGLINTEALTRGISNKVVKTLADWGVDMVTEGAEEVLSEVVSNLGTALYKEENVGQILGSEEALDSYLDSFIGGAVLGGVMNVPKAAGAIKNKTDYRNGLTANEQKVFDKVYEDAVAEAQKDGKTLSKKDKAALHDRLLGDIDKGYISTDTIEEVLGGENYKNYKRLAAESEEYEKLYDTPYEKLSEKQRDRLAELKKKNAETAYDDAVSDAYERLRQQVKKDGGKLVESYNERQRRGQKFQADTSKYSEAEASIVQKAIDSGVMNNTNRSHEFVDLVAKIGAEKGIAFDFADNAKIKESGFGITGKTVNGFVTKAGVTVNTQSQKALEKVVGHEITHILEGTELYQGLQTAIFDYAKGKGDFDGRRSTLEQMYKDIEGADIDGELTADLVGDYLFTDADFLRNLSTEHRNVFQKIYDEIKHLCKLATAGTKEARQLEKVKKAFDEAYRVTKNTAEDGGVKYSLNSYTEQQKNNWKNSKRIELFESQEQLTDFIQESIENKTMDKKLYFGAIPADLAAVIKQSTGINVENFNLSLGSYEVRKILKDHGSEATEAPRGQRAVVADDFAHIVDVVLSPETITRSASDYMGKPAIIFTGEYNGRMSVVAVVSDKRLDLFVQTVYVNTKKGNLAMPTGEQAPINTPEANNGTVSDKNISPYDEKVNTKYSLSDSQGRQLSDDQAAYFENSKVRDDDGKLKMVYHGSGAEFTEFSYKYMGVQGSSEGRGFYFTDNRNMAEGYQKNGAKLMEGYLDIQKPLSDSEVTLKRSELVKLLKAVDPTGDDVVINYDYTGIGYPSRAWYNRALNAAVESIYTSSESDSEILAEIANAGGGNETVLKKARELFGYDGYIVEGRYEDATVYVAFESNQFKNADNLHPTKEQDIRYSLSQEGSRQSGGRFDGEDLRWLNVTDREETSVPEPAAVQPEVDLLATDAVRGKTDTELERNLKQVNAEYQEYVRELDRLIDEGNRGLADAQWSREYDDACRKLEKAEAYRDRLQEEVDYRQRADSLAQMEAPEERKAYRVAENADRAKTSEKTTKPVAQSKAIIAKKDLRGTITALFSIPAGSKQEMGKIIDGYADRLVKNGSLTESDRQAFFRQMYEAGVMEIPANEYYAEARSYVKGGHIYLSPDVVADLGDDLQSVRRRAFANGIYLTTNPEYRNAGVDVWNHELADALPGLFDAEDTDLRSVLEHIIQVAEDGRAEKKSLAEYTQWLSGHENVAEREFLDNMERQMDQALRTFAEKADLEIKLRDRTGVKIAQERQAHQEAAQRAKERKELQQLQQKTLKQLQWLSKNRNKAPEELCAVFDEVLGDLDIYAVGAADEMRWSKKYEATWRDLSQMYQDARASDPNFLPSKELEKIVARLNNSKIADLDIDALNDLYKAAVGLRTEYYNRNNVINDENHRLFAEVYNDIGQELTSAPGGYKGKTLDKLFNTDQLTPMNVLQRMAGWNPDSTFYTMARQLETGERDMRAYKVKAQRQLQAFLTKNEAWVKTADGQGKNAVWYEVEVPELTELGMGDKPIFGKTVKVYMTPAQKVHLYLESKNYDNLRHMTGGRTFVNKELYSQGKRQEAFAQGKTIRLAPETVKQIVSKMTPQEMALANLLEKYYNQFSTQEINRVSNILYGYDKAMGKNYAPIYSNSNYTNQEFGVFDSTAEGVGNLKGRVNSKNPTYNISAFDAFEKHMDQTARFVGMAIPARNWTTLMNWQQGKNSTGDIITHKWGQEGKNYITELITDLQNGGGTKTDVISSSIEKLQSNYISAVFGANPSIVLKQMGSIPLAGAYLGMKNFPSVAQIRNIDRELIAKYSQDLDWRTIGYSMPETKMLKDNPNWTQTNKFFKFTFGGGAITAMDGWAASTLWPWAENKVHREHPKLEVGTREQINSGESPFYKKVAEEFENALARSQSTSDEIHQSNLRKSKNAFTRVFTMFRSDSAQVYNAIRQKVGEAQYYMRSAPDSVEARKAKRAVGVTMATAISGFAMAEGVELLMNLWKRHGDGYRDEEEKLTAESILGEVGAGLLGDMAGVVVGGEEVFEIIGNVLTGEKWYGIDTMGMEQLNDCLEALSDAGSGIREIVAGCADVADKGGDVGEYFRSHENDILGGVKELAQTAATYLGIPANNVEAYLLGPMKWVSPALNTAYEDLFDTARKEDLAGLDGISLTVRIEDLLNNRNVGTSYKTADTLAALYEQGYKSAVPSSVPSSISMDGESRGLSKYEKQVYSDAWSGVVAGNLDDLVVSADFAKADDETRAKMLDKLYRYAGEQAKAAVFGDYEMSADTEKTMAVSKVVPVADFIGWDVAASAVQSDKDENGKTISGSRKKKIVALLNELDHLTYGQKIILYRAEYPSDDTYCADIVEYLNELDDLRYADRVTILAALGFRISEDGNMAYWD